MKKVSPVPEGYHNITPYLVMKDAAKAIDYYKNALGASEVMRMPAPGGKVGHAELRFGDSHVMLADEFPDMGYKGPQSYGGTPVSLMLYVNDVDAQLAKATAHGAKILKPIQNQFYGDRSVTVQDPFGHVWTIATHIEDVPPEEMEKRAKAAHPA